MSIDLNIDPKALGKVAVLMGGTSAEREVSLTMSGPGVLAALREEGVDAHGFDPAERGLHELKTEGFERVFIALHGRHGEDGTVQGALELLGIPYTGSGVMASSIAMDKIMTKRLWLADGLPSPRYQIVHKSELGDDARLAGIVRALGLPLIVKPPHEGSSIGITKVSEAGALRAALEAAAQFDDELLCEEFVEGQELTCPVLGADDKAQPLPTVRIEAPEGNYDYQNKYFTDVTRYHAGSLSPALEAEVKDLVLRAFRSLGCRGWGRADLMLRKSDNKPFLLEMNTSPGMTSHSLVPISARAAGISYSKLCLWVLSQARLDRA
ncbi:D-alanine--D-alanine ligase [Roseateles sp. DAIF2]|uniref:D-alanine--D-alanine ligase n=1 Tax=Roseateles sp. DAIF2 TaxID=2714952 RepID=UPI0018A27AD7|nr:D-alanine--D-alanine ligase [Roseateles sp. DAIF2]QPF75326.1 D-alanine--D-alanine ligase [Roseateles sp. DAIF2]